jgi:hypothetical protein
MRTIAIAAIVFAALSLFGNRAEAGPWCAHYNTGLNACSFYSFEQCMASVFGVGGSCAPNQFEAQYPPRRDVRRSYQRAY